MTRLTGVRTGDQPKNWRATKPRTGGRRPEDRHFRNAGSVRGARGTSQETLHEDSGKGRKAPHHRLQWTQPRQRRHTSLRARGGPDVWGTREDLGRRGREASKHSAEVGIPQEVSQYSAESRRRSEAVLAEPRCTPRSRATERHSPCETLNT